MKWILLLMVLLYSGYSFCGCGTCVYVTLNGKLIANNCGTIDGIPIDSSMYYSCSLSCNVDTIYVNPNESILISGFYTHVTYNDTLLYGDLLITSPGYYWFASICDGGAYESDIEIEILFKNIPCTQILNSGPGPIKILSNPVGSILKLNSFQTITQLNIYDQFGRLQSSPSFTSSQNTYEASVDGLSSGVYVVEVMSGADKKDYIKIVKQ